MPPRVIRKIARPPADAARALGELGVATVYEAQGRTGLMRPSMRPIYPSAQVAGPAVTVLCPPGDNLMIHAAVEVCSPGDVLVVATTEDSTTAMFGELLATSCRAHGVAGLVIDGGVRDVADLTAMNFPIWAKVISAQGPVRVSAGSVNIEISCAGASVRPGDVIVADQDGVVVVPSENAMNVASLAQQRHTKELRNRERFRGGELGLDMYGLRSKLAGLGVEYIDSDPANKEE
jgi:4-hydroxy-4-methyl-2-oxoglutarate aldolase